RLAEMFVEIPRPDEAGRTELRTVPTGRYASYRALDGKLLGVGLSDQYRLLQTRQAAEMADAVVEAADGAVYEAAFAGYEGRIAEARRALGVLYLEQRRFSEKAERMVERPLSDGELEAHLAALVPVAEAGGVQARAAALNARSVIRDLYLHDPTLSHL